MVSPELLTHLQLNVGKVAMFLEVRRMSVDYMRKRSPFNGPTPMDVNWLDKGGKHKQGKNPQSKGKRGKKGEWGQERIRQSRSKSIRHHKGGFGDGSKNFDGNCRHWAEYGQVHRNCWCKMVSKPTPSMSSRFMGEAKDTRRGQQPADEAKLASSAPRNRKKKRVREEGCTKEH